MVLSFRYKYAFYSKLVHGWKGKSSSVQVQVVPQTKKRGQQQAITEGTIPFPRPNANTYYSSIHRSHSSISLTNKTIVKFNGPIFPAATYTAQYVAFYQRLGGASSADRVILIMNFGAPYSSGGNVFAVGDNTIEISALTS